MKIRRLHDWNLSCADARRVQVQLADRVVRTGRLGVVRTVAGADVSCARGASWLASGVVVMSFPDLEVVEEVWVRSETQFPYVPGLLSFREIPGLLAAFARLRTRLPETYAATAVWGEKGFELLQYIRLARS